MSSFMKIFGNKKYCKKTVTASVTKGQLNCNITTKESQWIIKIPRKK